MNAVPDAARVRVELQPLPRRESSRVESNANTTAEGHGANDERNVESLLAADRPTFLGQRRKTLGRSNNRNASAIQKSLCDVFIGRRRIRIHWKLMHAEGNFVRKAVFYGPQTEKNNNNFALLKRALAFARGSRGVAHAE